MESEAPSLAQEHASRFRALGNSAQQHAAQEEEEAARMTEREEAMQKMAEAQRKQQEKMEAGFRRAQAAAAKEKARATTQHARQFVKQREKEEEEEDEQAARVRKEKAIYLINLFYDQWPDRYEKPRPKLTLKTPQDKIDEWVHYVKVRPQMDSLLDMFWQMYAQTTSIACVHLGRMYGVNMGMVKDELEEEKDTLMPEIAEITAEYGYHLVNTSPLTRLFFKTATIVGRTFELSRTPGMYELYKRARDVEQSSVRAEDMAPVDGFDDL